MSGPAGTALVNGAPFALPAPLPVDDVVRRFAPGAVRDGVARGVAVAVGDAVVPRSAWSTTLVRPGDVVEVVGAVQGG
ncbi:sulfur carrier protein ThiS [Luteimicrobium subarcticum]|uniref:Sulfur carrier protein n=1 Tax=Luteimicrobium subarcticum TaxID=620910 RepID=A0A2M8WV90_9MICO|nr:sulfur carrier protein ThiS [Luteimicrobium subarcticum]PJI94842.1 sulfur carrier protein [Luteimicrobium subarcticum]